MNYKNKIELLLDNATPDQLRGIARKAMIDAMPKACRRRRSGKLVFAIEEYWQRMLQPELLTDWRDKLEFPEN